MNNKSLNSKVVLSFADLKRMSAFFQLLNAIDKRANGQQSQQKKSPTQGKKIGSPKKRAYLLLATVCIMTALILLFLNNAIPSTYYR